MYKKIIIFTGLFCLVIGAMTSGLWAAENPEAVSPGSDLRASVVDEVCPTFSWAQVPGASAYQIAVFEMSERYEGLSYYKNQAAFSQPVLTKKISGSASSWTPSLEQALQNGGRYVWFVQAQDAYSSGTWSIGKKFAVRAPIGLTEIKEKVKQELEARGIESDLIEEALKGIGSQDIKSKSGGELKGKIQEEKEEAVQSKLKAQENKEIRGKENQTQAASHDFTAGALGSEEDTNGNVYYGTGTDHSLPGTANYNSFFGLNAGYSNSDGDYNTFMGLNAGYSNTEGDYNTFLGYYAGYSNTEGDYNTFIGNGTGVFNTTGNRNTFIGNGTGIFNTTGYRNTFIGNGAGYSETGSNKLYIENSDSSSPLIYGEFDNDLVTINGELFVTDSNINVDTASTRARFKLQADGGGTNTDDFFNFTMRNDYGDVTLSVRDSSAGVWLPMLSYEYLNSKVDFKDNDIVTTGTISSGGGAYTSGGAWIEASSRDYKENIAELGQSESIQALETLNPVRYNYKNKKDEEFLGFIAEDVPDLVAMNGRKGMRAMDIVAVLTKVVQDQQEKISEQEEFIHDQNEKNKKQDGLIIKQEELLKEQMEIISELKEKVDKLEHK